MSLYFTLVGRCQCTMSEKLPAEITILHYVLDQNRHKKLGGGVRSLCEISAWTGSMTTCFTSWWNTLSCWTLSQNRLHQHRKFASTLFFVLLMNDKESSLKSQLHPLRKITHALSLPIKIWNG